MLINKPGRAIIALSTIVLMVTAIYLFTLSGPELQLGMFITICTLLAISYLYKTGESAPQLDLQSERFYSTPAPDILVVDDNKANQTILKAILHKLSFSCSTADNGQHAIDLHHQYPFKLILMDIEMDVMNGTEATQSIRRLESDSCRTPIIGVSAYGDNEKKHEAIMAGFDDYITKPIDEQSLTNILDRWLNIEDKDLEKATASLTITPPNNIEASATPEQTITHKVVDLKKSLSYSRGDTELAKDMLTMLIDLIIEEKEAIDALFQEKKWNELGHLVHKINGCSCYCGVPTLQNHAEQIDKAIQRNDIEIVEKQFPHFLQAIEDLLQWNDEYELDIIFES